MSFKSKATCETSVIMPVRNGERYIAAGVGSALAQLKPDDQLIVIDDASTDNTRAILSAIDDSRIEILAGAGRGVSSARNAALAAVRGEFIAFLDHDDLWPDQRQQILLAALRQRPEVDAAFGRIRMLYEPGIVATPTFEAVDGKHVQGASLCTGLFRRRILSRVDGFDETMRFGEDIDYYVRLIEAGMKIGQSDLDALIYRRHHANSSNDRPATLDGFSEMLRRKVARHRRRGSKSSLTVSVIIAVRNAEAYLAEAIDSVLEQSRPPEQLIVVNDGSTNGTRDILDRYKSQILAIHQDALGQTSALNRGIARATGNVLGFNDGDDLWCMDKLERQVPLLERDPEIDAVLGHVRQFVSPDVPADKRAALAPAVEVIPGGSKIVMLIRRAFFDRIGAFDENYSIAAFVEWMGRARKAGLRSAIVEDVVALRRLHLANTGRTDRQNHDAERLLILKRLIDARR